MESKKFIIIGASGYIARKHFSVIKKIGGELAAVIDPVDNLDILDNYFPAAEYFRTTDDAETFVSQEDIDYCVICSPTYLHLEHIAFGLRHNCNIICESPAVLSRSEYQQMVDLEQNSKNKVFHILQYRYDPEIIKLKDVSNSERHAIEFKNYSARGKWWHKSWKGDPNKSGGLLVSHGYHFFDALIWIFGLPVDLSITTQTETMCEGLLSLPNAKTHFILDINRETAERLNFDQLVIDGESVELSKQDDELYLKSYREILSGKGIRSDELKNIIELLGRKS